MPETRTTTPRPAPSDSGRELVLATIATHAGPLLALARRYSYCADDAHDAYQRAMEIFLRRAGSLDPVSAPAWLRTVVKHEALSVRAARRRFVAPGDIDPDRAEARDLPPAEELAAEAERTARSTEALARLKPQEVRALVLKARGYSYREIQEITGWTYTKVNRCLTEGRRAFLDRLAEIESGRACKRWEGALSALADGEATPEEVGALRPHMRHCPACRARLREFRGAPRRVAALAPAGVALGDAANVALVGGEGEGGAAGGGGDGGAGLLARAHDALLGGLHERVLLSAHKVQAGVEAASAGKLTAVAASATALAGGGAAALHGVADRPRVRPASAVSAPARGRPLPVPSPAAAPRSQASASPAAAAPAPSRADRDAGRRPVGEVSVRPPVTAPPEEFALGGDPTPVPSPAARTKRPSSRAGSSPPRTAGAPSPSSEFGP